MSFIDEVHRRIDEGGVFSAGFFMEAVADDDVLEILIRTHATRICHILADVQVSGDAVFFVF